MNTTALFFDTETTGLPLFNEPSEDPRQPHIVQLGARLVDLGSRTIISTIDVICRPDGWTIPDDVAAVHGISTEHAERFGVSESVALGLFLDLWRVSDLRIAHNESFDARIIRIGQHRFNDTEADAWQAGVAECTAKLATPIMKLPPTAKMKAAGRSHYKTANLAEAYRFFTGREIENAHSALADVDACMAVYFAVVDGVREPVAA